MEPDYYSLAKAGLSQEDIAQISGCEDQGMRIRMLRKDRYQLLEEIQGKQQSLDAVSYTHLEDMILSYKQTTVLGKAETIASSLNTNLILTGEGAEEVVAVLGPSDVSQIVITDADGTVLYSTNSSSTPAESCALYPEIVSALRGNDAFRCEYTVDAFESYGAIPIMVGNVITGCVYVTEVDMEQAAMLVRIQENAIRLAVLTILISVVLYFMLSLIHI